MPASSHVRFGNRTFGTVEIMPTPAQNYTVLHRNFCQDHVRKVREQYLDVRVFDIGDCPSCGVRKSV